uniref:Aminotransferase-like plant mobile domain-containing protein n=1 Tax=Ananas comosus var. bracteatus TaxID=296719 RepID=A0A6V7PQ02_ANACO|nr:unnamed protein product [Ananas comosus var. bracteatus]
MAPLLPLPTRPSLDYTLLRPYLDSDPVRFILGPSFTEDPSADDFPFSNKGLPLMAENIHLHSWYPSASMGRSLRTWPSISDAYLAWLDRVQATYGDLWRETGIYEAIQGGPLTPTLFDVAAIVGLRPHGVTLSMTYNPDGVSDFEAKLDLNDLAYSKFLRKFAGESPALVTKKEHTAFLLYRLCHNLFCTRSQKINRDFVSIAVGLSNGDKLALGPYFLAFVYRKFLIPLGRHPLVMVSPLARVAAFFADQSDITPNIKCFVATLSSQLSSYLARQRSLDAELVALDQHFHRVDHFRGNIPDVASPIAEVNREDQSLVNQESALRQRISTLKEELVAAESTLAQTSERRLQLGEQLKSTREKGMKIQEELS